MPVMHQIQGFPYFAVGWTSFALKALLVKKITKLNLPAFRAVARLKPRLFSGAF